MSFFVNQTGGKTVEKKLMLIINPAAGKGAYENNLGAALHALDMGGYRTSLFFTSQRGDATEYASSYAKDFDTVACIGGDGTLSEVMSGLMELDSPPPLGYFPMGTANDVATTLNLPKNDTLAAARRIVHGAAHPFDVGGFGDSDYFAYIAAFGAFTEVSYATPQEQKRRLGHLAYVLQGAMQLAKIESYRAKVEYDDGVVEGDFLYGSMSNSTSVAGIVHLRDDLVCLGDGYSELVLVKNPENILELQRIVDGLLRQNYDDSNLVIVHTKKAKFTFEKLVAWTRDGEAGGEYKEIEICNHHCPIQLIF
jgi:YegS/Rv2252/BmrU family lipid kinase